VSPNAGVLSKLRKTADGRVIPPALEPEGPAAATGGDRVRITTPHGSFTIELFEKDAPLHSENFKKLARDGSLEGLTFHKVLENYMALAGAADAGDAAEPGGGGKGGLGRELPSEGRRKHVRGSVGAPRVPRPADPERPSSGSEFYISFVPLPDLDGLNTVFGQVVEGMDVVDRLKRGTGPGGAVVAPGSGDKILSAD
jgi:cyclophilin family peptidyl-prolyl cis-trans isomerase